MSSSRQSGVRSLPLKLATRARAIESCPPRIPKTYRVWYASSSPNCRRLYRLRELDRLMAADRHQRARTCFLAEDFQLTVAVDQRPWRAMIALGIASHEAIDRSACNSNERVWPL